MDDTSDRTGAFDDPDLTRLSSADPAGPEPDLSELRTRVLAAAAADADADAEGLSSDRSHRASGRLIAGGIAAAVALLAAGTLAGVALGRATSDDPILAIAEDTGEVPAVNTAPQLPSVGPGAPGASLGARPEATMAADRATSMIWPGYADGFEAAPGLTNTPGAAAAYRLTAEGIDPRALARQLGSVFDVPGEPTSDEGVITVGSGEGPTVWVYDDATLSWSYTDASRDPWACPDVPVRPDATTSVEPGLSEPGVSEPGVAEPGVPGPCTPVAPPIGEGDARDRAEAILTSLGVSDAPGLAVGLDWETFSDGAITTATAWQTLDGARTQLSWSISFDSEGPIWGNGFAAGLESVGDLPVVGARTAVERSAEPRWRAFGPSPIDPMVMPMVAEDAQPGAEEVETGESDVPRSTPPGDISIHWDPVIVTDAEPTITQYWSATGEFWLLPGYRLATADDRGDWVVIAVAEIAVSFTSAR